MQFEGFGMLTEEFARVKHPGGTWVKSLRLASWKNCFFCTLVTSKDLCKLAEIIDKVKSADKNFTLKSLQKPFRDVVYPKINNISGKVPLDA